MVSFVHMGSFFVFILYKDLYRCVFAGNLFIYRGVTFVFFMLVLFMEGNLR